MSARLSALRGGYATTLTQRQREVLRLKAHGLTHEEVGERLGITLSVVRTHASAAYRRLGVDCDTGAYVALGWLSPPH